MLLNKLAPFTILFLLCTSTFTLTAQPIRNLDFEEAGVVNPDQPVGWSTHWTPRHRILLDSSVVYSGRFSLQSHQLSEHGSGFGMIRQSIPGEFLYGKTVHIEAWAKSKNITAGSATLRLAVFNEEHKTLQFVQFPDGGVTGTTDWQPYKTELVIDDDASLISLDAFHGGNGTVWFDHFKLEIDKEVFDPDSFEPWQAAPGEVRWLQENIIPLSTDDPESDVSDLEKLKPLFKDTKIVGLGEATHGTREFFRLKHRLVKWFAQQSDTTVFAIEANMPETRIINEYVLHGKGDPREALAGLGYWTWNSEEVLEMIKWMRSYNKSDKGRIEFWGFDMAFPDVAADSVRAFVKRADLPFLKKLDQLYSVLKGPEMLRELQPEQLSEIYKSVIKVRSHLQDNRERYLKKSSEPEVEWTIQYARIVEQAVRRFAEDGGSRDRSMAENIKWIYNQRVADGRMLIWAHNEHVERSTGQIGRYLSDHFDNSYKIVGFAFGEGEYTAVRGLGEPVETFPALPPMEGSADYVFHSLDIPCLSLT